MEAHLFFAPTRTFAAMETRPLKPMQTDIENRLAAVEPDVEVLAVEQVSAQRVRLVIDHPDGVDLALCERVTAHLRDLLALVGLEVSSPGPAPPAHQARPLPSLRRPPRPGSHARAA